jgi:hypothetical protein
VLLTRRVATATLAAVLCVAVLGACGGGDSKEAATTSELPPGCDAKSSGAVVESYLAAVTKRDRAAVRKVLANDLRLFEVHDGRGSGERNLSVKTKAKALAYVDSRIAQHEQLRLVNLQVQPADDANHVIVTFTITRLANDFRKRNIPNRVATGDGILNCVNGTIEGLTIQGP